MSPSRSAPAPAGPPLATEVLVIGSGAGGAGTVTVRAGKGDKDRVTTFPTSLAAPLKQHLARVKLNGQDPLPPPRLGTSSGPVIQESEDRRM